MRQGDETGEEKRLYEMKNEQMRRNKKTGEQNRTVEWIRIVQTGREERGEEWLEACTNPDKLQLGTSMLQSIKTH